MGLTESIIREGCSDQLQVNNKELPKAIATPKEDNDCVCIRVEPPTKPIYIDKAVVSKAIVKTAMMCPNKSPKLVMSSTQRELIIQQILQAQQMKKKSGKMDRQEVIPNGTKRLTTEGRPPAIVNGTVKDGTTGQKPYSSPQGGTSVLEPCNVKDSENNSLMKLNYFTSMYEKKKMKELNAQDSANQISNKAHNTEDTSTGATNNNIVNNTNRKRPLGPDEDLGPSAKSMFIPGLDKYDNTLCLNFLPDGTIGMDSDCHTSFDQDFLNVDSVQVVVNGHIPDSLNKALDLKIKGATDGAENNVSSDYALDLSIGNSALNLSLNPDIPDVVQSVHEDTSSAKPSAAFKVITIPF